MAYFEIFFTAFTLQLLALPGEKGQFIISGLSTKYHPLAVVSGASVAFGGWTAVEIIIGQELKNYFSEIYLDGVTTVLLISFGIYLFYLAWSSNDESESESLTKIPESILSIKIPQGKFGVIPSFLFMAVGEFGDKTQLITISLAATYGATSAIWIGEMLAIIPFSLLNAYVVKTFASKVNSIYVYVVSGLLFTLFAIDIALSNSIGVSVLPL